MEREGGEGVRERLEWKYLLGLELTDPGFDASVLVEFRQRLLAQGAEQRLLDKLLQVCREHGWLKAGGKMRTDATHVLAAVRSLHHLETVGETLGAVLEELGEVAPDWLLSWVPETWFKRYEGRMDNRRLPKREQERRQLAEQIGRDGMQLLRALEQADVPAAARELESVQVLHLVWPQFYEEREGQVSWRDGPAQGAEVSIVSPYDTDARLAQKRDTAWCGYKVHLTETCEPDLPELVAQVKTQLAPRPDVKATLKVQQELAQRQLLPQQHLLDAAYLESEALVKHPAGVRIIGPVPPDTSWQALAGPGSALTHVHLDCATPRGPCPPAHPTRSLRERPPRAREMHGGVA